MPYLNTNDLALAVNFVQYINQRLGYDGAYFFIRRKGKYIKKYGRYRAGLNVSQSLRLEIEPAKGSTFNEVEVVQIIKKD